jgi:hypothetical protein
LLFVVCCVMSHRLVPACVQYWCCWCNLHDWLGVYMVMHGLWVPDLALYLG